MQRENVVTGLPGLKPMEFPLHAFELEIDGQDRSRGYVGVFRLGVGAAEYRLRLRGVDLVDNYQVTLDNGAQQFTMSGRDLSPIGLPIGLPIALPIALTIALTSELVMYERVTSLDLLGF